jgi:putative phage-type endonuclease
VSDVIAKTKNGWGASRANYMAELIVERLTGVPVEQYMNSAMKWGIEAEPLARDAYSFYANADVKQVGFILHPTVPNSGASPDGFVNGGGLVEIKCPNTATHLNTLLGEPIDAAYIAQMQWQMACTGRFWCDWVSYDPRLPECMRLFVQRVPRDDAMIADLEKMVLDFLAEIEVKVRKLRELYEQKAAA